MMESNTVWSDQASYGLISSYMEMLVKLEVLENKDLWEFNRLIVKMLNELVAIEMKSLRW